MCRDRSMDIVERHQASLELTKKMLRRRHEEFMAALKGEPICQMCRQPLPKPEQS